jgi:cyclase
MVSDAVCIPVIASGGAGTQDHFVQVFETGAADAALAASVFHDKMIEIGGLKDYLSKNGVEVRR